MIEGVVSNAFFNHISFFLLKEDFGVSWLQSNKCTLPHLYKHLGNMGLHIQIPHGNPEIADLVLK